MDEQRPDDETEAFELDWDDLPETFTFDMVSQLSIGHVERLEELADDLTPEQRVSLAAAEHELFAPFAEAMSSIMPRIKLPHIPFGTTGADILGLKPSCFASLQRSLMPALTHANRIAVTSLVSSPALTRLVAEQRTILAKQLRVSLFPTPAMGGHLLAAMRDLATASSAPPDNLPNLDGLGRAYELVETGVLDSEGLERANEQIEADPQLLAAVEHAADLLAPNAPLLTRADAREAIVAWVYVCWIALTVVATVTGAPVLGVALTGLGAAGFGAPTSPRAPFTSSTRPSHRVRPTRRSTRTRRTTGDDRWDLS